MKLWPTSAILLLVTIYLARTGMGYVLSLSGPTLLYLTELVHTEIQSFSLAFSLRFVGVIIGGVMVGFVMHRTKEQINQLYLMAIFLFLKGLFNLITPWLTSIWIMSIAIMVIGITFGYLDAGLQAIILRIWGATTSRPLIYLYHFTIGIGGIFAPIIAEPFLLKAYGHRENNPNCPGNSTSNDSSTSAVGDQELNPVAWSYIIIGIYFFVITILTLALAYFKTDEKAFQKFSASENVTVEKRKEEPIRDLIWVFAPLIGYYFCSVSNEILFNSFIYPVAVCSELKFSIPDATLVNSLYWIGLMVGRGSGIFAASYIRPAKIAIFCIAGTIIMMWILVLFGRTTPQVTWAVSIVHGFFVGPLYPSGESEASLLATSISVIIWIVELTTHRCY
ncbi:sodium-dependent glucose transporter 1A-like isoform X2 [Clavelina lepadiformis]|uniref:sodium-dependent glucose transporter 1A-like isoform X2 n=1 Tax=Clavelina lepadiformis TaxID=159417 RepID=UPI00404386CB